MRDFPEVIVIASPEGEWIPVTVRRNSRARRLRLRLEPAAGGVVLVVPPGGTAIQAEHFARNEAGWIAAQLKTLSPRIAFEDGLVLPVAGEEVQILAVPGNQSRAVATRSASGKVILGVSGGRDQLPQNVVGWLRARAREEITHRVEDYAARLGRTVRKLSIRDTRTRWGSCTADGRLSFCWRLILAPEFVLSYVCAHEVSHLVEMNHSPAFWGVVETLVGDWRGASGWLRDNGPMLHRFG